MRTAMNDCPMVFDPEASKGDTDLQGFDFDFTEKIVSHTVRYK